MKNQAMVFTQTAGIPAWESTVKRTKSTRKRTVRRASTIAIYTNLMTMITKNRTRKARSISRTKNIVMLALSRKIAKLSHRPPNA